MLLRIIRNSAELIKMNTIISTVLILFNLFNVTFTLVPPKFQWPFIDYKWEGKAREEALRNKIYVPENNLPYGIAKWREKLFITVPRWKRGVPASLNYIDAEGARTQPLAPYPSWNKAYVADTATSVPSNSTVVSTFRIAIDKCDRLWVIDTGIADIYGLGNQITPPALLIFDLKTDNLLKRYELENDDIKGPETFFANIIVDIVNEDCNKAFAYIPDMGANTLLTYSLEENSAWRVDHPYFHFDPHAGEFRVGEIDFYWSDGISGVALTAPNADGYRDLFFHPLASTRLFRISTKFVRHKDPDPEALFDGVKIIGNRGSHKQSSVCVYDPSIHVLFFTLINNNGIACWNTEKPFNDENNALIVSDCNLLEYPSDLKVDNEGNLWILSNKMPRFLYSHLNMSDINYRVLTAPVSTLTQGTACEPVKRRTSVGRALSFLQLC